jgi:hypothetical protein
MPRPSRSVVALCVAVIALAAFLPGVSALDYALLEPRWILLPDEAPVPLCITTAPAIEQPRPLLSLLPSRAPPALPLA